MNDVLGKDWFKVNWKNQNTTYSYVSAAPSLSSDTGAEASLEPPILQELVSLGCDINRFTSSPSKPQEVWHT